jgi:hypothetical protein
MTRRLTCNDAAYASAGGQQEDYPRVTTRVAVAISGDGRQDRPLVKIFRVSPRANDGLY